jgi:tetratricopeptide (TPR) repeat protein
MGDCERSLQLDPADPGAFDARGLIHLRLRNYLAAIRDYDTALAANPNQATSLYGRGVAKIRSGNANAGNADLTEATKIDANIAATMTRLGVSR